MGLDKSPCICSDKRKQVVCIAVADENTHEGEEFADLVDQSVENAESQAITTRANADADYAPNESIKKT